MSASYSLRPMPEAAAGINADLVERLRLRAIEIDHRLGPIPGSIADQLVRELRDAAREIEHLKAGS